MVSRILSFLLGALLTAVGWAIVDPKGLAGAKLPGLEQLGMFEGHRVIIGWAAVALGVVALLSSVLPRDRPGKRRRGPPLVDFDADPAPVADAVSYTPSEDTATVAEIAHTPSADTTAEEASEEAPTGGHAPSIGGPSPRPLW